MTSDLLGGDLAFPDEFVKRGFRDLQVGGQLFNSKDVTWVFIHQTYLSGLKAKFNLSLPHIKTVVYS